MVGASFPNTLIESAQANYREMFRTFARLRPEGVIHEEGGLLLIRSGPMLPYLNSAHLIRLSESPDALLARAREFYARFHQSWGLTTTDDLTNTLAPALLAAGRAPHPSPGMLLAPLSGEPSTVPGLRIEAVSNVAALRVYNDTMTAGFGNVWALPQALGDDSLLSAPGVTHYVGFFGNAPVATATGFRSHGIAGVYNVSTVPTHRKRGIGAALTWRAALDGRAAGCIASALQASEMGLPVYRRIGYQTFTTYTVWLARE